LAIDEIVDAFSTFKLSAHNTRCLGRNIPANLGQHPVGCLESRGLDETPNVGGKFPKRERLTLSLH